MSILLCHPVALNTRNDFGILVVVSSKGSGLLVEAESTESTMSLFCCTSCDASDVKADFERGRSGRSAELPDTLGSR